MRKSNLLAAMAVAATLQPSHEDVTVVRRRSRGTYTFTPPATPKRARRQRRLWADHKGARLPRGGM